MKGKVVGADLRRYQWNKPGRSLGDWQLEAVGTGEEGLERATDFDSVIGQLAAEGSDSHSFSRSNGCCNSVIGRLHCAANLGSA